MGNTRRAVIDIYDEDGVKCESVGGAFEFDDVRETMMDALRNDGIPVIRMAGERAFDQKDDERDGTEKDDILQVNIIQDGVTFQARGKRDDVLDAMEDFLALTEE